jgi:predicted metal-dependent enzyme (double-stranded beta helix superfamily)
MVLIDTGVEVVRESARALEAVLAATGGDPAQDPDAVTAAVLPVLDRLDVFGASLPRKPNHTDESAVVYFDPKLCYIFARASKGQHDAPHNHGGWNITAICSGQMHYRGYRRVDDGSKTGFAELELVEDRVMAKGDVAVTGLPPDDIHEVTVLTDDQWTLAIAPGLMSTTRQYYDLASRSYEEHGASA